METEDIKTLIKENEENLPLFIEYSEITPLVNQPNSFTSKKYKDSNFEKFKFYKPISRLY